ncbi:hypothetical protein BJD55_gp062 [Gordonia phage Yvonnetastic]|uniref:Uncharacterized protein n=1 Tax=Gordonia phage Yvonnetastic TaxID=1821566 RepID=A0A142K9C1_9CAUD|nr:hypothetical protein BJD55_gp062 [Gordonia phage Yvonnetastic]AMS02704.1 hypothetical protein SEA_YVONNETASTIC_160 [Gordonia phage Yvonnetastic]
MSDEFTQNHVEVAEAIMRVAFESAMDQLFDEFQLIMDEEGIPEEHQATLVRKSFGATLGHEYQDWLKG